MNDEMTNRRSLVEGRRCRYDVRDHFFRRWAVDGTRRRHADRRPHGAKNPNRLVQRNDYYSRDRKTLTLSGPLGQFTEQTAQTKSTSSTTS